HSTRRPPRPHLFPYTTLFRSEGRPPADRVAPADQDEEGGLEGVLGVGLGGQDPPAHPEDHQPVAVEDGPESGLVPTGPDPLDQRSEEHTSELQSLAYLVCRLL